MKENKYIKEIIGMRCNLILRQRLVSCVSVTAGTTLCSVRSSLPYVSFFCGGTSKST
ncbi:hypothetical protein PAXRUDRAFT_282230 [Paxillus rubicundulus Ve08.2h10]|uniref:Uncharacterized protein n=1 Tax=Paxillus rubicundulus Ve08.2h10 TaxID=930991 RepID=A0A0D0DSX9_9AGAM|nr:hypothetical protein PAXRUDRAFT_282230 [Paxillus rubicundulus Ve08.2h10]